MLSTSNPGEQKTEQKAEQKEDAGQINWFHEMDGLKSFIHEKAIKPLILSVLKKSERDWYAYFIDTGKNNSKNPPSPYYPTQYCSIRNAIDTLLPMNITPTKDFSKAEENVHLIGVKTDHKLLENTLSYLLRLRGLQEYYAQKSAVMEFIYICAGLNEIKNLHSKKRLSEKNLKKLSECIRDNLDEMPAHLKHIDLADNPYPDDKIFFSIRDITKTIHNSLNVALTMEAPTTVIAITPAVVSTIQPAPAKKNIPSLVKNLFKKIKNNFKANLQNLTPAEQLDFLMCNEAKKALLSLPPETDHEKTGIPLPPEITTGTDSIITYFRSLYAFLKENYPQLEIKSLDELQTKVGQPAKKEPPVAETIKESRADSTAVVVRTLSIPTTVEDKASTEQPERNTTPQPETPKHESPKIAVPAPIFGTAKVKGFPKWYENAWHWIKENPYKMLAITGFILGIVASILIPIFLPSIAAALGGAIFAGKISSTATITFPFIEKSVETLVFTGGCAFPVLGGIGLPFLFACKNTLVKIKDFLFDAIFIGKDTTKTIDLSSPKNTPPSSEPSSPVRTLSKPTRRGSSHPIDVPRKDRSTELATTPSSVKSTSCLTDNTIGSPSEDGFFSQGVSVRKRRVRGERRAENEGDGYSYRGMRRGGRLESN